MTSDTGAALPSDLLLFERGWLSSNGIMFREGERACLVDTGYSSHAQQTLELVNAALGDQFTLTHVLNTHLHSDHCGGNALLVEHHPHATIHVPELYAPAVSNWDAHALSHQPTGQVCPSFKLDGVLQAGQVFQFGHRSWQIIHAPGHDDWAVMLFCADDGILISGDALWGNGFGVVFPAIYSDSGFERVGQTLDVIEALKPSLVIPGHGKAFTHVGAAMDKARSRLSYFLGSPTAHATHAAKVLIKFKLLEWQEIELPVFQSWCEANVYLNQLHQKHFHPQTYSTWLDALIEGMVDAKVCRIAGEQLINQN